MSLAIITDAMKIIESKGAVLCLKDKEFVFQFAFQTEDEELTNKLIEELAGKDADARAVKARYQQVKDKKPVWVENMENLLVALEMYRIEEEKAIGRIVEFFGKNGIEVSEDMVKYTDIGKLRGMASEAIPEVKQEKVAVL